MAVWSTRSAGYKLGVGLLFLGSVLYLVGFASPFWLDVEAQGFHVYSGLWMGCMKTGGKSAECVSMSAASGAAEKALPGWLKAVQAMQCVGVIGLVAAGVYAVVSNVRQNPPSTRGALEALAAITGLCGLVSCIIFVSKATDRANTAGVDLGQYFGWAFGLSVTASILFLIVSPVIYNASRTAPASPGSIILSGAPVAVAVQQSTIYPPPAPAYPPQPGYPAQPVYGYDQDDQGYAPAAGPPQAGYGPAAP